MKFQSLFTRVGAPLLGVAVVAMAYRAYGWQGVAAAGAGLVMWLLLHFTRMMNVLKKAANMPVGFVGSAVMLNARLDQGMTLLHVVAMTKSLGTLVSVKGPQPEVFTWTDASDSVVTLTFAVGKLQSWKLVRPEPELEAEAEAEPRPAPKPGAPALPNGPANP